MKTIEYPLFRGQYINRFVTTGTFTQIQKFERATLKGKVNEWLDKGFAIHENPCRKEFVKKRDGNIPELLLLEGDDTYEEIQVFGQSRKPRMYFPFGNIGYDASFFYKCPTYIRTYCYVDLWMPDQEDTELEIETCGGVTIWNNHVLVTDYIPFTRNLVKRTTVVIHLEKGCNHLVVCLDDLAERDTDYYFRLRYQGTQIPKMVLPLPENSDAGKIKRYESILENLYFTKESYSEGKISLLIPTELVDQNNSDELQVFLPSNSGDILQMLVTSGMTVKGGIHFPLLPEEKKLAIADVQDILPGYKDFLFRMQDGEVGINRNIGCQIVWKKLQQKGSEKIEERRKEFLDILCEYGADNIYKVAAMFQTETDIQKAEQILLKMLGGVNAREDCSDFCFIVILYIYKKFYKDLSETARKEIEKAAVNYRYWIDEPGDDVMWFFSENHALLFHICQYLAGSYFPKQVFTNSGRIGQEVKQHGEELLNEWFDAFFEEFVTEWNSNAYIPIDVHGFGFLYNLTDKDTPLHEKAKKALDMVAYSITMNAHKGVVMTSFGRTYEKELKGNDNTGITTLLYILYNAGHLNCDGAGSIALAVSDYTAPEEYRENINPKENMIFMNTQGYERHVNLYLYKNQDVVLSTAVQYKPFKKGYQEHIVQAAIDSTAQAFVNHPGEVQPYGTGRPNFWAGNGELPLAVQDKDLAVMVYRISKENRIDFTHAYMPLGEFEAYILESDLAAAEKDEAYIGVKALNGCQLVEKGVTAYRELVSEGRNNVWVICVGAKSEYRDLKKFVAHLKNITIQDDGDHVAVTDGARVLDVNIDGTFTVNGEETVHYPLDWKGVKR